MSGSYFKGLSIANGQKL